MTNKAEIFNFALIAVGDEQVADPDGSDPRTKILNSFLGLAVDAVLRDHPWNCATQYAAVAADGTAPPFGWSYRYPLPSGADEALPYCLFVREVNEDPGARYEVVGRWIYTDLGAPLKIKYTRRITNLAELDPLCASAVGAYIGWAAAYKLARSRTQKADAWEYYRSIRRQAKGADASENPHVANATADEFYNSRY